MCVGRNNHGPRLHVEPRRRPPQQGQQEQQHEERRDDVDGDGALETAVGLDVRPRGDPCVLDHHVQAVQLGGRARAKVPDALKAAHVDLPDLDDAALRRRRRRRTGGLNVGAGRLTLVRVAARQDDLGRAETAKVPGGFQAQAHVGPGDDDGLALVVLVGVGQ